MAFEGFGTKAVLGILNCRECIHIPVKLGECLPKGVGAELRGCCEDAIVRCESRCS